jgi:hypothetical protein
MRKLVLKGLVWSATFVIGVSCCFAVNGKLSRWPELLRIDRVRSCQIKWVGSDGHAVWAPCSTDLWPGQDQR